MVGQDKTDKWSQYLRAPQIYFNILSEIHDNLVPLKSIGNIASGIKTGINEFFYFDSEKEKHWGVEPEFLVPVIKSPREANSIRIVPSKLKQKIFVCSLNEDELRLQGKLKALHYIEWGAQQINDAGTKWNEISSVAGRTRWYDIGKRIPGQILPFINSGDIHRVLYNPDKVFVDHNFFEITVQKDFELGLLLYLNSSLAGLVKELVGRANLGEGGLKVEGIDWEDMKCPTKPILKKYFYTR